MELEKYEKCFGLRPEPGEEQDEDDAEAGEDEQAEATDDDPKDAETAVDAPVADQAASDSDVTAIMAALGVKTVEECIPAIERLKTLQSRVHQLAADLAASQAKVQTLDRELALYRGGHLAELFGLLDAKTAKEALQKARSVMGADHAAQ